jgi:hypothetical protein
MIKLAARPDGQLSGLYKLAGGLGFEPRLAESESAVLPLDDPPSRAPRVPGGTGIDEMPLPKGNKAPLDNISASACVAVARPGGHARL